MDILGLIGTITGVLGLLVSVLLTILVTRWQHRVQSKELEIERAERTRAERLNFLADRIFDIFIPRDLRLPFYEEYISMKGNGTAVRFWLLEGNKEKA